MVLMVRGTDTIIDSSLINMQAFTPDNFPFLKSKEIYKMANLSYSELFTEIIYKFCGSCVNKSEIYEIARDSYKDFEGKDLAPLTDYNDNIKLCELKDTNYISTNIDNLNPSLTFCFSYKTENEFMELKKFLEKNTIFNILHKKYVKINTITHVSSKDNDWEVFN